MLRLVETEIRRNAQITALLAGVQVNNPAALRFWQQHGFHIISGPELMPDSTTVYGLRKALESGNV